MADHPLRPAIRRSLGRPLPHQQADRPRAPPKAKRHFLKRPYDLRRVSGIRPSFPGLSRSLGQVAHVILTRSPLDLFPKEKAPFDLHVLSTPPAFVLSQDQTLHRKSHSTEVEIDSLKSRLSLALSLDNQLAPSTMRPPGSLQTLSVLVHLTLWKYQSPKGWPSGTNFWLSLFRFQRALRLQAKAFDHRTHLTHAIDCGGVCCAGGHRSTGFHWCVTSVLCCSSDLVA